MNRLVRSPSQSLPDEFRAGDAHAWSLQTGLAVGTLVFYVLTGVIANTPQRFRIGGNGVAVDAHGNVAFDVDSVTSGAWLPGRYEWVAFSLDASNRRNELARGEVRILPDVAGDAAVDPRSFNQKVLDSIRQVIAGNALDDVQMYKIGGRELTKIPRADLMRQEAIFERRVRSERARRGEFVPTKTRGITFGGRGSCQSSTSPTPNPSKDSSPAVNAPWATPEHPPSRPAPGGESSAGFAAAKINRLTMDFIAGSRSADQDLFGDNVRLRARARKLAIDNPHARKFLAMAKQNVVGEHGIQMKSKLRNKSGLETAETTRINQRIEEEWKRWCKMGRCTADGRFSFPELQQMSIVNIAREGENLVRYVYGSEFNDTGFALQPLDNDQLDDSMMLSGADGSEIRMGVEVNKYRRPIGCHLFNGHPYDSLPNSRVRTRVPADQILHAAVWERPAQTRGYTWMAAAILPLNHYGGFEEATLAASRASAAKFLVIEEQYAEGTFGGDDEDEDGYDRNSDGTQVLTANSGEAMVLDVGQKANFIDPKFPTNTYKEFSQAALRSVASGLLVSYAFCLHGWNVSGREWHSIQLHMERHPRKRASLRRFYVGEWFQLPRSVDIRQQCHVDRLQSHARRRNDFGGRRLHGAHQLVTYTGQTTDDPTL